MGRKAVKKNKSKIKGSWSNPAAWAGLAKSVNMIKKVRPIRQPKSK